MNMNNFHQAAFNNNNNSKPRLPHPQMFPHPDTQLSQQQFQLQMEQFAKMNGNINNFPPMHPTSFNNGSNNIMNTNNFNDKNMHNQHQHQQQQQHSQMPKYPFEFELNPALRQ